MSAAPIAGPVVVGTDGSGGATRAVAWAAEEADLRGLPLQVVCVLARHPHVPAPEADALLRRAAAVARINSDGRPVESRIAVGTPAYVLARLAADAELLVVGNRGGGRALPTLGTTAARLARTCPCALAVVRAAPGRPVPDRGRPVLVAVDGRPGSAALVRHAARLAANRDAELQVVHVWKEHAAEVIRRLGRRERVPHREEAERALEDIATTVAADHPGLRVRWTVERGGAPWSVLELSDVAQLVVVGRHHGRTVGTPATVLLQASSCPVLLAPQSLTVPSIGSTVARAHGSVTRLGR
ncbi:universal stress protein [Pseudonocardia sp. RS11V-5]|uniref:universal stress protein n=1 Tax=Pseudonocardia terrae TaxID=2905831 RepID=UPI001E397D16|nr:universal stress protein [Pseudonocardia terrae]MCE3555155.1 universal stress protein [Pseudonocardia terrae]